MKRFIEGESRSQLTLMPECLEDYIGPDNPVRVVEAFVEALDLADMGFDTSAAATGRPGYHPGLLLKLYIYGYLNSIQSSRRLEREAGRNVELMWLSFLMNCPLQIAIISNCITQRYACRSQSFDTDRQVSGGLLTATDRLLNGGYGRRPCGNARNIGCYKFGSEIPATHFGFADWHFE